LYHQGKVGEKFYPGTPNRIDSGFSEINKIAALRRRRMRGAFCTIIVAQPAEFCWLLVVNDAAQIPLRLGG
jgi:hypothetical protein